MRASRVTQRFGYFSQLLLIVACVPLAVLPPHAMALPTGGTVAAGNVAITTPAAGQMNLTQTGNAAIVNWSDFSIGAGEIVTVNQAANAALLNRVTGANMSQLLGQLNADGRVFLINPNGVVVGAGANINAQEFIASAHDVDDAEFLDFASGDSASLRFESDSTASVVNAGAITASDGDVILVAYKVDNSGTINAANGVAGLAAGKKVWFMPQNAQHLIIESSVSDPGADAADGTGVANSGNISAIQAELKAAAANVYALAINQTGMINATGVENRDGRILLTSDEGTVAHTSGTLTARNADGGGGEVLIGGDYHGLDSATDDNGVHLAATATVGAGATIDVSASSANADGGRAVVWAGGQMTHTGATTFAGTINASGGDGGFVVVAGHDELNYTGSVDVSAAAGAVGTLVMGLPTARINAVASHDTANGILSNTALATQLASANVVIDAFGSWHDDNPDDPVEGTPGFIRVTGNLGWTSANQLTLKSGHYLRVSADITAPNAPIEFQVMGVDTNAESDSIYSDYGSAITADSLTIRQNADSEFIGFNPPPEANRHIGRLNFQGPVIVDTLNLHLANGGISFETEEDDYFEGVPDAIRLYHGDNEIGTLNVSGDGILIDGNVWIVDSTGDLTVNGNFSNMGAGAYTAIETAGSLTLEGDTRFAASTLAMTLDFGDETFELIHRGGVALAAKGGSFINNSSAGVGLMSLGEDNYFAIYSDHPDTTVRGGLSGERYYGESLSSIRPRDIGDLENSAFYYSFQPTLTFTANVSRTYGDENPTLTYTVTGLIDGDDLELAFTGAPELSTAATAADGVGDYAISVDSGTVDYGQYGYELAFVPGTLTINPAALTITADDKNMTLGGTAPALTASYSGFVNGDTSDVVSGLVLTSGNEPDSPAGPYDIVPSAATATNYEITFVNGTLLIATTPTLQISADDYTIRYGDALPNYTATITGFGSGDDESIVSGLILTGSAAEGSPVGTYTIVPSGATADGYEIFFNNGTLTIDPALLTIAANNISRTYGETNPSLGVSYTGFVNGEDASVISGLNVSTTVTETSDAGTYAITVSGATAPNYLITQTAGTFTVNPAPLTIDVDDFTKIYAELNPTFTATITGLVLNDTLESLGALSLTSSAVQLTGTGDYAITGSFSGGTALSNYDLNFNPGTLTITPRSITAYATHETRVYGDANPTVFWGLRGDPVPGMNLANLINPAELTKTTEATQSSNVGVYSYTLGGITNPNLNVTYEAGSITVTPAPLTVRVTNRSRIYGSENPTWVTGSTGLKLSDTVASVIPDLTFTTAATITSNVGTYTVTPSGTVANGNYDVTFTNGTLTINKAPLTITPTLATRVYGDPDPTFTITATGLLNGDSESVVTSLHFNGTSPVWGVGSHPLSIIAGTATNYTLSFSPGILNVTPRPLTITANDATREYGEVNPTFTASFDNLASFDDANDITGLAFSTVADATSSALASGYGINVTSNANANYTISYETGRLVVTPAPLLVNLSPITREYGETTPTPTASVTTGLKNGDTIDLLGITYDQLALPTADVGTFAYEATASNPNYNVAFTGGTQTITPAPLAVAISDVLRTYGDANPDSYTVFLDGLKFAADTADIVQITNPTAIDTDTGTYHFGAAEITGNYTLTSVTGDIRIAPRSLNLDFSGLTRRYGDDDFTSAQLISFLDQDGLVASFDNPADVFQLSTATNIASGVGTYDVAVNITNPNYMPGAYTGALAITPRPLTVVLNPLERVFGQDNPTGYDTYRVAGGDQDLMSFDALNTVLDITAPAVTAGVGNYSLTATLIDPNYTLTRFSGAMSVLPRPITLQMPDSFRRVYGDANPAVTGVQVLNPGGLPNSGLASFHTVDDVATYQLPEITADVGVYSFNTTFNPNYDITLLGLGSIIIDPRPIAIGLPDFTRLYGDANPTTVATDLTLDHISQGLVSFDSIEDAVVITSLPDDRADVGTYTVGWEANQNYDVSIWSGGEVTVDPRRLVLETPPISGLYGEGNLDLPTSLVAAESDGFAAFDDYLERRREIVLSFVPDATTPAGTYTFIRDSFPNYEISVRNGGTFTINPRDIIVVLPGVTRLFGEEDPNTGIRVVGGDGLASFETMDVIFSPLALPGATASVGDYQLTEAITNGNYNVTVEQGSARTTITARPVTFDLSTFTRLYGEANPITTITAEVSGGNGLASFHGTGDVLTFNPLPGTRADAGTYDLVKTTNPNYQVSYVDGSAVTVSPRELVIGGQSLYRTYGDTALNVMTLSGDGFATGDTFDEIIRIAIDAGSLSASSNAGYYPIFSWGLLDETNYRVTSFQPDIVTILPRPITMEIANQTMNFTNAQALIDFFSNPNLVFEATAANLAPGDDFDDAFPIVRYQIIDANTVPTLATLPTINNVYLTSAATLRETPSQIGAGVYLIAGNERVSSNLPSFVPGTVGSNGVELNKFITVFDGYDTEENYVLTGVTNATIRLTVPATVVSNSNTLGSTENTLSLGNFTLSANLYAGLTANQTPLVVRSGNEQPPTLFEFFTTGHQDFGVQMISNYITDLLGSEYADFAPGSLLAEITREAGGSAADVTEFQIQRWLERNADNPAAMALLAEPLAAYAKDFLNKDPGTYTASEQAFGQLLSQHMSRSRDQYAARVKERYDEYVAEEAANGHDMSMLAGRDVPWSDFMTEGASQYISEDIEAHIAVTAVAGAAGAQAAGAVMIGLTSYVMPFAFGKVAVGMGTSIAAGSTMVTGASAGALVAVPVVAVTGAIVGSIARGFQLAEAEKQEGVYQSLMNSVGRSIDPAGFSLETASGKDDVVNQAIMMGALATFLLPGD